MRPARCWVLAVLVLALAFVPLSHGQFITQLFSDDACKNLISTPIPKPSNSCVADLFSGTFYQTAPSDSANTAFRVSIGCSTSACSGTHLPLTILKLSAQIVPPYRYHVTHA